MTGWWRQPFYGYDCESSGLDVESDRIVTATLVCTDPAVADVDWLLDPLIEIPQAAADVHGITTEMARTFGTDAATGVGEIAERLCRVLAAGIPVVVMNASFDLTLLDRECRRHQIPTLTERLGSEPRPIIDPFVIDKQVDRYRKGKRNLQALCDHYQVRLDGAHSSAGDALAAARVAWRIMQAHPEVAALSLDELHDAQTKWRADWAADFEQYLAKQGKTETVDGSWPLRPAAASIR